MTLRVYIGYDPRDDLAFEVCAASILKHSSIPVDIRPLKDWELRQAKVYMRSYRVDESGQSWDDRDGKPFSTQFSFTRFAVPILENYADEWVVFVDADFMFKADIAELLALADPDKAVMCVQHNHYPPETVKMYGCLQTQYFRKNWSSLMLIRPSGCRGMTRYELNNSTGQRLHSLVWVRDEQIGALPKEWNWLEGWDDPKAEKKAVHYTRGTPDMLSDDLPHAEEWWSYLKDDRPPIVLGDATEMASSAGALQ